MSKINIEIDTEEETIAVSIDGVVVENVYSVSAYTADYGFDASVMTLEKQGDLQKRTMICASERETAKRSTAKASVRFKGMDEITVDADRIKAISAKLPKSR